MVINAPGNNILGYMYPLIKHKEVITNSPGLYYPPIKTIPWATNSPDFYYPLIKTIVRGEIA